jgi:hypothetical protein
MEDDVGMSEAFSIRHTYRILKMSLIALSGNIEAQRALNDTKKKKSL